MIVANIQLYYYLKLQYILVALIGKDQLASILTIAIISLPNLYNLLIYLKYYFLFSYTFKDNSIQIRLQTFIRRGQRPSQLYSSTNLPTLIVVQILLILLYYLNLSRSLLLILIRVSISLPSIVLESIVKIGLFFYIILLKVIDIRLAQIFLVQQLNSNTQVV